MSLRVLSPVRLFLALSLFSCVGCTADQIILGTNTWNVDPGNARRGVLRVDGRAVEYWSVRTRPAAGKAAAEPSAYVLFFVGKRDRPERWVQEIADNWNGRPVEVWGMNYPGSGGSDGPVSLARVCPDALAVFDRMKAAAGGKPVYVRGSSFGTVTALSVAARRPVDGLVLQNPAPLRQLILGYYSWWNLGLLANAAVAHIPPDLDSIANARACRSPAVFVLSGADGVIPPNYHKLVVDVYAGPKRLVEMPYAGHNDPLTEEASDQLRAGLAWISSSGGRPVAVSQSDARDPAESAK